MKRPISILLGFALLACMQLALARGGDHRAGERRGGAAFAGRGAVAGPGASVGRPAVQGVRPLGHPGWQGVRPIGHPGWQGVRPTIGVHLRPGSAIRNHRHPQRSRVFIGGTVVLGAPIFYSSPVYVAPSPVYAEPPVYIEQGSQVYYYCPDYRDYYPNVATCPSPWLRVLPEEGVAPN
jgi:hypothetical protein